jgi:hypothetical protein
MASENGLIWGEGSMEEVAPLKQRYRQNPDGTYTFEQGRDVIGQDESDRAQSLAWQARNRPQTNIDRYWLDQDIAQGQQSRDMQQQGLGALREAAMGNAPSQAALMANMARGRAAASGVGATGGLAARQATMRSGAAMNQAAMQGAGGRADEIGRSTGAYMGGTGSMMSGDLRNRGASGEEAYRTAQTALRDKKNAAELGLRYERLGQDYRTTGVGATNQVADWQANASGKRAERNNQRGEQLFQAGMGALTSAMSYTSGITTKTDIAPAAGSPKMGAPLQPDQIASAFGPEVAAAVQRSRAKYQPQNALAQMPAFSQDSPVAGALARSNDVPVDLSAMDANYASDIRAKKDIKPAGSSGKGLVAGQPAPMPRLAPPPEEPSWIPIAQTAPRAGLARIHSDAASKKEIESLRKQNEHMKDFIGREHGMRVKDAEGGGTTIFRHDRRPPDEGTMGGQAEKAIPSELLKGPEPEPRSRDKKTGAPIGDPGPMPRPSAFGMEGRSALAMARPNPARPAGVLPGIIKATGEADALRATREALGRRIEDMAPGSVMVSDENQKSGGPGASTADAFLDSLSDSASTYRYKDPSLEPSTTGGTGGKYLGIMAQRVEQTPEIGHQLVKDTPQGKVVEGQAMLSALAGGLGRLHQKVKSMEGKKR